ncbi:MAG: cytochrome c3 family protein [Phycisphaerae bacterium]|nr:cytochrome c3 family protein [Phycisphaerae bacterium]
MADTGGTSLILFPRWANFLLPGLLFAGFGALTYVPMVIGLVGSPQTLYPGYAPVQPVEFSHAVHAGKLGMDCRYCHTTVEKAAFAAIPPTETCMNCHTNIKPESPKILPVRESALTGMPIEWTKVHDLPGYAYFNHSAHVNKGVSCVSCHGRIDQMEVVRQVETLTMGWCLDCHRAPEKHLRPVEEVTNLGWTPPDGDQLKLGKRLKEEYGIRGVTYMTSCSTCHR